MAGQRSPLAGVSHSCRSSCSCETNFRCGPVSCRSGKTLGGIGDQGAALRSQSRRPDALFFAGASCSFSRLREPCRSPAALQAPRPGASAANSTPFGLEQRPKLTPERRLACRPSAQRIARQRSTPAATRSTTTPMSTHEASSSGRAGGPPKHNAHNSTCLRSKLRISFLHWALCFTHPARWTDALTHGPDTRCTWLRGPKSGPSVDQCVSSCLPLVPLSPALPDSLDVTASQPWK